MVTTVPALVEPSWVAERLGDPGLVLVEVDEEAATHHWSHVPGATYVDWQDCRQALLAHRPGSTTAFEELMSSRGIRPEDDVVLYGDAANRYATAVLWLLRHHGHRSLRVMDGGRAAWAEQGRAMTDQETVRPVTRYRAGASEPAVRATRDDVLQQVASPASGAVLLDCRTHREYVGEASGPASDFGDLCAGRGHVPGAVNLPAGDVVGDDGRLLPHDELLRVFADVGLRADQHITVYCHTSDRSCLVWFALHEVLGFPWVRVYDGGWIEYGHLLGAPVAGPQDGVVGAGPAATTGQVLPPAR